MTRDMRVADVGSGTGILTEQLLQNGNPVFGIEPNSEMRRAAERQLAGFPNFTSVEARAEATTLPDRSVGLVVAAQSFHWFNRSAVREEFRRIIEPGGCVALMWNDRRLDSAFARAYEQFLLEHGVDYAQVNHRQIGDATLREFFAPSPMEKRVLSNTQILDAKGFKGRVSSASYAPEPGHPKHEPMRAALVALFEAHQRNGRVTLEYDTLVFWGRLA